MEFSRKFSKIIDDIRTDYQLCNDALRAMLAERKSDFIHNSNPLLCALQKFEATLRALTETCNCAAQSIDGITQQIRAADTTSTVVDADAVSLMPVGILKTAELSKYLDAQHNGWVDVKDDGYIGADYRQYMNGLKAIWVEYEFVGWHCTESTDLAIKNFIQQHQIIISILENGVKDANREKYQRSLQPRVAMLPVAYFFENMAAPPLKADVDIRHGNEYGGASVKDEFNSGD